MTKVLFLSIDGLLEPLGESQILNYCLGISKEYQMMIFSLEKSEDLKDKKRLNLLEKKIKKTGIKWFRGKYNSSFNFFSYPMNLINSLFRILFIVFKERNIKIIHLRGYVLGPIALLLNITLGIKILFDMRGFWPDEKVDRSAWSKNSPIYLLYKFIERRLLIKSEAIVSLTHQAVECFSQYEYLEGHKLNTEVIRTCTDLQSYKLDNVSKDKGVNFVHLGSVDTAYDVLPVINFFKFFSGKIHSKITFINRDSQIFLETQLERNLIKSSEYKIISANFSEIPILLKESTIGLFNTKLNFSIKASVPTKIGEFLASGLPILCNDFNKDVTNLIEVNRVGLIIDFNNIRKFEEYFELISKLLSDKQLEKRCRNVASEEFNLKNGIESYLKVYKTLA